MHCFYNSKIAVKAGVNSALIADHLWATMSTSKFKRENRMWLKFSAPMVSALFPHMKRSAAAGALKRLVDNGILVRRAFDKRQFDHTYYYSFTNYGEQLATPDGYDDA